MKNCIKVAVVFLGVILVSANTWAQPNKNSAETIEKKEEIVIRKNGKSTEKTTIVIEGDKVTVNGKPVDDFNGSNITIIRRDGSRGLWNDNDSREFEFEMENNRSTMMAPKKPGAPNKALLGVMTMAAGNGAKVTNVSKGSAAEKAGIKNDDIITKVGDEKIENPADLAKAVAKYKPEEIVNIILLRDKKEQMVKATLDENKSLSMLFRLSNDSFALNLPRIPNPPSLNGQGFQWNSRPKIGFQVQDVEQGNGVVIKEVEKDTPAEKAGLKEGDIIFNINDKELIGVDDMRSRIIYLKEGDSLNVDYKRDGKSLSSTIKIPKMLKTADL